MRQGGIVSPQFFFKRVERFLWFALPCDDPKCPVCNFLAASKPFVSPGKKNRSGKATFYDAIDVPTEHVGLLVFRMPDRVHAEFPKDQRMLTAARTASAICLRVDLSRRNSICFSQGSVTRTRMPAAAQRSRNQRGGAW